MWLGWYAHFSSCVHIHLANLSPKHTVTLNACIIYYTTSGDSSSSSSSSNGSNSNGGGAGGKAPNRAYDYPVQSGVTVTSDVAYAEDFDHDHELGLHSQRSPRGGAGAGAGEWTMGEVLVALDRDETTKRVEDVEDKV